MSSVKPREPNSIEEALSRLLLKISPAEASRIIGKSESLVRKASDPDISYCLSLRDAIALDAAFEAKGFGEAPIAMMYRRKLEALMVANDGDVEQKTTVSPLVNLSILMEEIGNVAYETNTAMKDGIFSNNEVARISGAIEDAINQLLILKSSIT